MPQDRRLKLYALSTCPACKKVKSLIASMGLEAEVIDVDTLDGGEQWLATKELKMYNPGGTYPTLIVAQVLTDINEGALRRALGL